MGFFCANCGQDTDGDIYLESETVTIAGEQIQAPQKHAYCSVCGAEVYSEELTEENDYVARHAYCIQQSRKSKRG